MNRQGNTLVILSPAFPTEEQPGWLPSQADFVRNLNSLFPRLKIIILVFHFPIVSNKQAIWHGNTVISFNGGMKGKLNSLLRWKSIWNELKQIRKEHNLLGIFSFFCSECAFIGHYFTKRYSLRHYIWVMGMDAMPDNEQVKRIKPQGDELIAISDFLVTEFSKNHGITPGYMIPIGVNEQDYSASQPRDLDIIGVGSLSPIKQYDVFIWVVKEITKAIPDVRSVICGGGSQYDVLQQQIQESDLAQNLTLTGPKSHAEAISIMQRARILLHPSVYEGFGMVCAEALCAAAHVISFCKPLNADVEHWHIVKTKEEMVTKAIELLQSRDTRYFSVVPHRITDAAIRIMQLFDYDEAFEVGGN